MKNSIKLVDIDIKKFGEMIDTISIGDKQIIEFTKENIISKGHPIDKTFVKYVSYKISDMMQPIVFPEDFKLLKLPFAKFTKFKKVLDIYKNIGIDKISAEIPFEIINDEFVASSVNFKSKSTNVKVECDEIIHIQYMPTALWQKLYNIDKYAVKYQLDKNLINQLDKLCDYQFGGGDKTGKIPKFVFKIGPNKISFSSTEENKWNIEYSDTLSFDSKVDKDIALIIPQRIVEMLDKNDNYVGYVVLNEAAGQYLSIIIKDENFVILNTMVKYDINKM